MDQGVVVRRIRSARVRRVLASLNQRPGRGRRLSFDDRPTLQAFESYREGEVADRCRTTGGQIHSVRSDQFERRWLLSL